MKRATSNPAVKPKTLVQQNSDFTSEGSPPPGHVGSAAQPEALPVPKTGKRAAPQAPHRAPPSSRR